MKAKKTTKAFSFSTTCRLCLAPQTNMIQIFDKNVPDLPNNIFYCTSLRVIQNDRLPHSVCNACFEQIVKFVTFKQICHKADELLRESVNSDNTDIDQSLFDTDSQPFKDEQYENSQDEVKYLTKPESAIQNDIVIGVGDDYDEESNHDDSFDQHHRDDSFDQQLEDDLDYKPSQVYTKHPGNRRGRPPGRKNSNRTSDDDSCTAKLTKKKRIFSTNQEDYELYDSEDDSLESYLIALERQDMIKQAAKCNYICNICFASSKTMLDYLEHQENHEGKPVFHCERCPEVFNKKVDLIIHEGQHQVPCPTCGKLVRPISLKTHMVSHTDKFKCPICGVRTGNKKQLESHDFLVHNEIREHVCETCGKRFKTKSALKTHNKSHSDIRAYPCKLCSYAGRTASGLYTHMTQHANDQIVCDVCAKIFTSRRRLNDHKWRIHNPEKKHECSFCLKKFAQKSKLTVHIRVHTGDRPYSCKLCARAFARSEVCRAHESKCAMQRFRSHCTLPAAAANNDGSAIVVEQQQAPPISSSDTSSFFKKEDKFCESALLQRTELSNVL